jgi:hypothetical protein
MIARTGMALVGAAVCLASLAGRGEAALDAGCFKLCGGTHVSDCANPASARVAVFENVIVFVSSTAILARRTTW